MRCDATRCDAMRCDAMQRDAMRRDATRCDAMQCDAMRCDAMRALVDLVKYRGEGRACVRRSSSPPSPPLRFQKIDSGSLPLNRPLPHSPRVPPGGRVCALKMATFPVSTSAPQCPWSWSRDCWSSFLLAAQRTNAAR
eukprot:178577-Chlamydomonas_euryale.AAC.1